MIRRLLGAVRRLIPDQSSRYPDYLFEAGVVSNQFQLAAHALGSVEVAQEVAVAGVDPQKARNALKEAGSRCGVDEATTLALLRRAAGYGQWRVPPVSNGSPTDLLMATITSGNADIARIFEDAGANLGAIAFYLAHGRKEPPEPLEVNPENTAVEIFNDEYTPFEFVIEAAREHLRLELDEAEKLIQAAHLNGKAHVDLGSPTVAAESARTINAAARRRGLPLWCRPVIPKNALEANRGA